MKKIILIVCLVLLASTCEAKMYVCLDKKDGTPQGTADIADINIADWATKYILITADESYRGLNGYEVKFQNQKIRKATKQEVDEFFDKQAQDVEKKKKEDALKATGLTDKDIGKIKKLPE